MDMYIDNDQFVAFRKAYDLRHQHSIPKKEHFKPLVSFPGWLRLMVFFMFSSAALLSGVHTIPTVYGGIQVGVIITEAVRQVASILSFVAVEMAVFISAYMMKSHKRLAVSILIVGVLVALVSNVSSVFNAFRAVDTGGQIVAVILGVGAPLIALMAGAAFVEMDNSLSKAVALADSQFQAAQREYDASVLSAYDAWVSKAGRKRTADKVSVSVSADTPDGRTGGQNGQLGGQADNMRVIPARTGGQADKRRQVEAYIVEHPESLSLTVRTFLEILNGQGIQVGRQLVSEVLKEAKNGQRTNGQDS